MDNHQITEIVNDFNLENPDLGKVDFCKLWPNLKSGLETLRDLINKLPATLAINGIIQLGEALKKKVCK